MKTRFILAVVALIGAHVAFAADVGVSISVGQPGFYGQIDIGAVPMPPQVIYPQPVYAIAAPPIPPGVVVAPLYLHVRPGHERHWAKYCRRYNACNRPVYFVRDDWYQGQFVPYYRDHGPEHGRGNEEGYGRGHEHEHDRGHGRPGD